MANRLASIAATHTAYKGTVDEHGRWTGKVNCLPDRLGIPMHWRKPKRIFVGSMSDIFHEGISDEFRDKMFAAMALSRHRFYLLTKRPELAFNYMSGEKRDTARAVADIQEQVYHVSGIFDADVHWPPPDVWLGVSVEDEQTARERIPILLQTPAAHWFVSYEPALEYTDFRPYLGPGKIEWLIFGVESGPHARECIDREVRYRSPLMMDGEDIVADVIAQCRETGAIPFIKQIRVNGRVSHDPSEWPPELRVQNVPE
jgi:protein gp37